MAKRPPRPRQDRFEAMTASIMERIAFRSGREPRAPPKVAPSSKIYAGSRLDTFGKSQKVNKSSKSRRSHRSSGRMRDLIDENGDVRKDAPDGQMSGTGDAKPRPAVRRVSTRRLRFLSFEHELSGREVGAVDKPGPDGSLSNFAYEGSNMGSDPDDGSGSDLSDEGDSQGRSFAHPAMSDGEDEVAYFANRSGLSEFKVRRRYTLHPHGRFRASWDVFQLLLMTWVLVTVPFELCFSEIGVIARRDILQSDLFVDAMFAIDILLNLNTAVERDGKLHFSLATIFWHYSRNFLLQDLLWTFPFYALFENKDPRLYAASGSASSHLFQFSAARPWLYPFSRCMRLLRVTGIPRIQRRLEYSLLIPSKVSSLGSFLFLVLALSHVFSCVFSYLAFSDEDQMALAIDSRVLQDTRLWTKYVAAFYWSIMTMTTVGYGDITVKTNLGRVFSLCAMAVGAGVFAYGITNVVSLFQQLYIRETEDRQKMDQVNVFMQHRGFPRKLRDEVRANIFNWRKVNRENKELDREIFAQMARPIRAKVADLFCEQTMPHRMPFLAGCDAEFVHDLYLAMQIKLYLPGEDIIRQGEYGSDMYFLFVGHAQALLGQTSVATFGPNACFGEFSIVNPRKARLATIQALDFCETHCVNRQTILSTLVKHPNVMRSVHQLVMLRSRKALTLVYESGGKSRTLLQGLAVMWRTDGIQGILPIDASVDALPVLQEFLPAPATTGALSSPPSVYGPTMLSAAVRRSSVASYNLTVDTQAAAAMATASQRTERGSSPRIQPRTARQRVSIPSSDQARVNAALASVRADVIGADAASASSPAPAPIASTEDGDNGRRIHRAKSFEPVTTPPPAKRLKKRSSNLGEDSATGRAATAKEEPGHREYRAILTQLRDLGRQQSALDGRVTEILSLMSLNARQPDRFHEQHRRHSSLAPLVRDRSQFFDLKSINTAAEEDW